MGKYGEEGDRLIFKILNNGLDNPTKKEKAKAEFEKILEGKNSADITERALRYDLTIPFARYVAMHYHELTFPYKRYQIQPVWRADRPQKGRYREFYQCDADIVGSNALLNEVEFAHIYALVFDKLRIPVEIKINSRKILTALAAICNAPDKLTELTVAIDKLDKIGPEKLNAELESIGLNKHQLAIVNNFLSISGNSQEKVEQLKLLMKNNQVGLEGIKEIEFVVNYPFQYRSASLSIDLTLARGLNYYTGIIFEVKAGQVQIGSIGGGGRYDDLTGLFGVPGVPGVGISFGVDRIYDVMEELQLFPATVDSGSRVLFFNLGEAESRKSFELMQELRRSGVGAELFHEQTKFDKQFKYAEKKNIPYVVILGTQELAAGTCSIKNLGTGKQETINQSALSSFNFNS